MNDNVKISVGLLIPAVSVVAFVATLFDQNYLGALFVAVSGLMVWFAYSAVVKAEMPDITGNIVMVFGGLLSLAFFLNYGLDINMFGGFELKLEGVVGSVLILFFTVLMGVLFNSKTGSAPVKQLTSPSQQNSPNKESSSVVTPSDNDSEEELEYDYGYGYGDYDDEYEELEDYYPAFEYEEEYED